MGTTSDSDLPQSLTESVDTRENLVSRGRGSGHMRLVRIIFVHARTPYHLRQIYINNSRSPCQT